MVTPTELQILQKGNQPDAALCRWLPTFESEVFSQSAPVQPAC